MTRLGGSGLREEGVQGNGGNGMELEEERVSGEKAREE